MKRLLLGSMIAAALLLTTGCGGDDKKVDAPGVTADTTAPTIGATATGAIDTAITLATDDTAVTSMTIAGDDAGMFTKSGATAKATTAGTYNITVTAEDAAGNSATKAVTVTVTGDSGDSGDSGENNASGDVVKLGDNYWVKVQTADTLDDETTADVNETTFAKVTYVDAVAYCTERGTGWKLPAAEDFLTIQQTPSETDIENMSGQLVLDPSILAAGTSATTSALWVSDADYQIVYLGNETNNASTYVESNVIEGDVTTPVEEVTYFHTCIKSGS